MIFISLDAIYLIKIKEMSCMTVLNLEFHTL